MLEFHLTSCNFFSLNYSHLFSSFLGIGNKNFDSIIFIFSIASLVAIALLYKLIKKYFVARNKDSVKNQNDNESSNPKKKSQTALFTIILLLCSTTLFSQKLPNTEESLWSQPGIIITACLIILPVLLGFLYAIKCSIDASKAYKSIQHEKKIQHLLEEIKSKSPEEFSKELENRRKATSYTLSGNELSGNFETKDDRGLINKINTDNEIHFTAMKKKAGIKPGLDPDISKLIIWYLGFSVFWLVIGTGIGEYLGIKFLAPEADGASWLSFGRLRPVHTNIVFWGWASLAMIGVGYYVVPIVGNTKIYSIKLGWIALILTNLMIVSGTLCLMAGINNGGGEFREYIWPVMSLFAVALILTLINFLITVGRRTTNEIYISNWYIVSSIIFTIVVALTAYLPFWQDGVSETIVQGYFMHSGVGMWFTLFTLGLLYYFIPQQINKPIYAYSLGILAFWTQIIFYTVIGTHHFIFAPIPWWLQTVGIVGSVGMIIPVVAATINYTMTFRGQWHKITSSYTLPFFLVAVLYYFIVSMQGTVEAFKFTNLLWHFTDFTVGHAHLGFYGIITFALWGCFYTVIPRLTGYEPKHYLVGLHFWIAFIGLIFYAVPLSLGATLRGLLWMEGKPFIDSVVIMAAFWLWRAIGGSLMFISHLVFAYNFYKMIKGEKEETDVKEEVYKILETDKALQH